MFALILFTLALASYRDEWVYCTYLTRLSILRGLLKLNTLEEKPSFRASYIHADCKFYYLYNCGDCCCLIETYRNAFRHEEVAFLGQWPETIPDSQGVHRWGFALNIQLEQLSLLSAGYFTGCKSYCDDEKNYR